MFTLMRAPKIGDCWQRALRWCRGPWFDGHVNSPQDEVALILRDTEVSMRDMASLTKPNAGPAILMPLRIERAGLDPIVLLVVEPEAYHGMQRTCAACPHWRRCARDLAAGERQTVPDGYCLNAKTIARLLRTSQPLQ